MHSAIDRLYRAEMVRVVYDPDGSIMEREMNGDELVDEEMKQDSDSEDLIMS